MEQNSRKNAVINLLVLLTAAVSLYAVGSYSHSFAARIGSIFLGLGVLVALVSLFQIGLEQQERLEKLEFEEAARSAGSATLFKTEESETFRAQRSREQFDRFFVPAFTAVLCLLQFFAAYWSWRWLRRAPALPITQPLVAMGLAGLFALVLFLLGKYSAGLARLANQRLLRPSASHLLLGFYICVLVVAGIAAYEGQFRLVDLFIARGFSIGLGLLALEASINLILEIYRPRIKGKVGSPLYESRVIGLLGQPEGLVSTVAHTLDYQFGFKVSETWVYRSFREWSLVLLAGQIALVLLSTCFVFIDSGEQALLERFGRPLGGRDALGAGMHLKLPWPIDRVYRYNTGQIQSFHIGFVHDEKEESKQTTVLWTVAHYKDEFNLLVASHDSMEITNTTAGKKSPPVNLLSVSIPVEFQIKDVRAWAYNNRDASELLEKIGTREVVRYLVGVDLQEMMSSARFAAGEILKNRIQEAADQQKLGAEILFVGLQDIHPPVKVARSYEAVAGARQKKEADILNAEAYRAQTNALAHATATVKSNDAQAARIRTESGALARAALFTNQMPGYMASPRTYSERAYVQTLIRGGGSARKIIMNSTNSQEVIILNLEEKIRPDLLDIPLPKPK